MNDTQQRNPLAQRRGTEAAPPSTQIAQERPYSSEIKTLLDRVLGPL